MSRKFTLCFLALALQAQEGSIPKFKVNPDGTLSDTAKQSCDATDWKARAEWLEQKLAITEAKTAALANFYAAQEQLTGLAAKEPPKPHLAQPDKP